MCCSGVLRLCQGSGPFTLSLSSDPLSSCAEHNGLWGLSSHIRGVCVMVFLSEFASKGNKIRCGVYSDQKAGPGCASGTRVSWLALGFHGWPQADLEPQNLHLMTSTPSACPCDPQVTGIVPSPGRNSLGLFFHWWLSSHWGLGFLEESDQLGHSRCHLWSLHQDTAQLSSLTLSQ